MSISSALTSNFESIYYVDVGTGYYLEFAFGADSGLQIRPGGHDFFGEARQKLLDDVAEADLDRVKAATNRDSLMRWLEGDENVALSYQRRVGGALRPYCLQTIRTRSTDDHHIVIGVRPE